ncbi:MAG: thioredoxin fold domain-containing protein [Williamsia sp.]|nr:thioredoxin fold domain-containing protein [Williamsia sp.]
MKYGFVLIFLFWALLLQAQEGSGVLFQKELSWSQLLDSAKKENKMVFVDIYTDWCMPCKRMEKEIFSLKNVGDTFNSKFINYRLNAEQGEGINIAKRYGVDGYPYFVFVDGSGALYYSMLGYRDEQQILQDAAIAFKEQNDPKPFGVWKEEYDAKKFDTAWLYGYVEKRNRLRMDNSRLLEDYYAMLKPDQYMKARNALLVTNSNGIDLKGKVYTHLTQNFTRISPEEDSSYRLGEKLLTTFEMAINKVAVKAIEEKNEAAILNTVVPAHDAFPDAVRFMPWFKKEETNWKFIYYQHTNNLKKGMPVMAGYINKYYLNIPVSEIRKQDEKIYQQTLDSYRSKGLDSAQLKNVLPMVNVYFKTYVTNDHLRKLTDASSLVYNNDATAAELSTALGWMKRALDIQESSANLEMMAKILYRLRRKQDALDAMQKAINKTDNPSDRNRLSLLLENIKEDRKM